MSATLPAALDRRTQIAGQIEELVREYLALDGENHANGNGAALYPLALPLFGAEEIAASLGPLLTRRVTMGSRVLEFEAAFADYIGVRHAVMVNSGSSANLLALACLSAEVREGGLRPGDEVIVPAVGWSTTVAPILQLGYVPVFVDVDPHTLNIQVEALAEAISPRTRAIMPVHLLGNPVDIPAVESFAREHDLFLIEDTCEALGSEIDGRRTGSFGHAGTYSFFFSHHITTVEGGMLVTSDDELANAARSIRAHGWTRDMSDREEIERANPHVDPRFLFAHLGYNLRPMETQAAFGLVQLGRLDAFNESRREAAHALLQGLEGLEGELRFVSEQPGGTSTWFGFSVIARDHETRMALARHLGERGIETRPIVSGNLAVQPAFRDRVHRTVGSLPNARELSACGLFIGIHPDTERWLLDHVVESFRSFFRA
jgi:CDP-4-dehydro-6-deoxyglucose reductase, E1